MPEFNLQTALDAIRGRVTPEQREQDEVYQKEMREKLGNRINLDSPEQIYLRTIEQEKNIVAQIEYLKSEPDSELKSLRQAQAFNRYAELLATRGLYADASVIAADEQRRDYYAKINQAIEHPETCECADERGRDPKSGRELILPALHKIADIYLNGEIKGLYQCRLCDCYEVK